MKAIDYYLKLAIDYELTHQIILKELLQDNKFRKQLLGHSTDDYKVIKEPFGGLFDLAIMDGADTTIACFEIKIHAGPSINQFKRQVDFVLNSASKPKLLYFFIGASDYEYIKDSRLDQLTGFVKGHVNSDARPIKIGISRLISLIRKTIFSNSELKNLAEAYVLQLEEMIDDFDVIDINQSSKEANPKRFYYSHFRQIQQYLSQIDARIYTVANRGMTQYILNDQTSWFYKMFAEVEFEVYTEILNGEFRVRVSTEKIQGITGIRRTFNRLIQEGVRNSELRKYDWDFHIYRTTNWTTIARIPVKFDDPKYMAELFELTNSCLEYIVREVNE